MVQSQLRLSFKRTSSLPVLGITSVLRALWSPNVTVTTSVHQWPGQQGRQRFLLFWNIVYPNSSLLRLPAWGHCPKLLLSLLLLSFSLFWDRVLLISQAYMNSQTSCLLAWVQALQAHATTSSYNRVAHCLASPPSSSDQPAPWTFHN